MNLVTGSSTKGFAKKSFRRISIWVRTGSICCSNLPWRFSLVLTMLLALIMASSVQAWQTPPGSGTPESETPLTLAELGLTELVTRDSERLAVWLEAQVEADPKTLTAAHFEVLKSVVAKHISTADEKADVRLYFTMGQLAYQLGLAQDALEFFNEAAQATSDPSMEAQLAFWRGQVYVDIGVLDQATKAYMETLTFPDIAAEIRLETLLSLGTVARMLQDFDRAIGYYAEARALAEAQALDEPLARVFLGLASVYRYQGDQPLALSVYLEGLEQALELNDPHLLAMFYNNLGNVHKDLENYTEALAYFDEALELSQRLGLTYGVGINHINQAVVFYLQGDYQKSLEKYRDAETLILAMDRPYEQRLLYEGFAYVYDAIGDYQKAYESLVKFNELNQALFAREIQVASEEIQTRYETLLKDSELALQSARLEQQRQRLFQAIVLILICLVVIAALIAFARYRQRQYSSLYERNKELVLADARHRKARASFDRPPQSATADDEGSQGEATDPLSGVYERLLNVFETRRSFTNPNLTLDDVAALVSSNRTYVSQAISAHADMGFKEFINRYRINEARRLLHVDGRAWSVQGLADEVGYGSRASFYRAFDRYIGMSPARYIETAKQEQRQRGK